MTWLRLTDAQRLDWLRLIRSERVGPRTFRALVNQFGGAGPALDALPDLARRAGRPKLRITSRADAEREMEALGRLGGHLVAAGEAGYPRALHATDTAPPLLAVRGALAILARPTVAIVGSRNASAAGAMLAERLATGLGNAGYVVASGLARGIDTRAHRAAIATGTVVVLAGGLDRVYPSENIPLLDDILAQGGAVVTEMPIGWEPRGRDFPRRNRIVSGLSYGVVVVEAARRSGSLITARLALEQGREVFAVPGSPLDARAEGTNDLIRNGATLCTRAADVVEALEPLLRDGIVPVPKAPGLFEPAERSRGEAAALWDELDLPGVEPALEDEVETEPSRPAAGNDRDRVICAMSAVPISVDDLSRQIGLEVRTVHLVLVELELAGRLDRHGGSAVSLRPGR